LKSEEQATTHVRILDQQSDKTVDIACNDLIVSSGPWTTSVLSTLFPDRPPSSLPQVASLPGHSVILRSKHWPQPGLDLYDCHALFITDPSSGFSPELFSRVGGEIYIAGLNDAESPLPVTSASLTTPDSNDVRRLIGLAGRLFKDGDEVEIIREGLCFRPITSNGIPIIGRLGAISEEGFNVWVASGHGPWGISLSLGTGLVLSQLVMGLPTSANVQKLAPKLR
jgi:glycine/D-amino acid oxidase-like deaminating enzyme